MLVKSTPSVAFLSIQAQDFIEDKHIYVEIVDYLKFLSIQAQDFIEEWFEDPGRIAIMKFLSIQAQDFIEDRPPRGTSERAARYS